MLLTSTRSHFSMGRSIVPVEQLVQQAAEQGYSGLVLTDDATISGMTKLFTAAAAIEGFKAVIGVTIKVFDDPTYRPPSKRSGEPIKTNEFWEARLFVKDDAGFKSLLRLLSRANAEDYFYFTPRVGLSDVVRAVREGGLILGTGDIHSLFAHRNADKIYDALVKLLDDTQRIIELVPVKSAYFDTINAKASQKAKQTASRVIYSRPVLYEAGSDEARDVMSYIMQPGSSATHRLRNIPYNRDLYIHPPESLQAMIAATSDLPDDSEAVFAQCHYQWEKMSMCLPQMAENEFQYLVELCQQGWKERLGRKMFGYAPPAEKLPEYKQRLTYELGVLRAMGFDRYFLLVREVINFAKSSGIGVGPARGSAAGSLVAYLIGITDVDPLRFNLIFERFLNPDRIDYPDVDTDFMSSRRGEVIQFMVDRFGADCVGGISNYTTLGAASAIRDVSRMYSLPQDELRCTKAIELGMSLADAKELSEISRFAEQRPKQFAIAEKLEGAMRSLGRHAAGVVVAGEPLINRAVVETRNGEVTVNWDKRVVEDFGLIKLDILGLSTLDTLDLIAQKVLARHGKRIDWTAIPLDDEKVLQAFAAGEAVGVFQFSSGGMRTLLKSMAEGGRRLTFEDIYAATALFRPGPLQSGMTEHYVQIKQGLVKPTYDHPNMEAALKETRGVIVYQEQVMQIARDLCGYTMAEADLLRKIMGKKDPEKMEKQREKFTQGAVTVSGMDETEASLLFDKIATFAGYGFNKSHSVAYTLISYQCMWAKVHYPAEFFAAALSIASEDELPRIVKDAFERDIHIVPPDINHSTASFEIGYDARREQQILYAPLNAIKQVSENGTKAILEARQLAGGVFKDREHFLSLVNKRLVNKRVQENLELVGAFCSIDPTAIDARHPDRLKIQKELLPSLMINHVKADRHMLIEGYVAVELAKLCEEIRALDCDEDGCRPSGVANYCVPTHGKKPKFMFLTDCAAHSEEKAGAFAEGKSFEYTSRALKEAGLKRSDGYYSALVKTKKKDKTLTADEINKWVGYLDRELELLKPAVIVAAGGAIARHLVPDIKGGWETIAGQVIYDVKRDCTIIIAPNPQMSFVRPEAQDKLDEVMQVVAEILS